VSSVARRGPGLVVADGDDLRLYNLVRDLRVGDQSRRVPVVNGTFLARFLTTVDDPFTWQPASVTATGYDADGRVLGRWTRSTAACFTAPDGKVVIGARRPGTRRGPAVRWR
jgi:hypothetical protein